MRKSHSNDEGRGIRRVRTSCREYQFFSFNSKNSLSPVSVSKILVLKPEIEFIVISP
jgi:hypothetical protein